MSNATLTSDERRAAHKSGLILAVIVAALYALYPSSLRVGYADGGNGAFLALAIVWARALGLTIHCWWHGKRIFQTREDTIQGLIGGIFQSISSGCTMLALAYLPGPMVVIIIFSHTLMLLFFMAWKREIKLDALTLATTVVALVGLSFVLDLWHPQPAANWIGIILAFIAGFAIVPRLYIYGHQTSTRDPAVVGAENFLTAAIFTLPIVLFQTPHAPHSLTANLWVLVGCTSLAAGTFYTFYGIARLGSFSWSLLQKLQPVFTCILSAALIGEVLKPLQYGGVVMVLASLVLYQYREHQRKIPVEDEIS